MYNNEDWQKTDRQTKHAEKYKGLLVLPIYTNNEDSGKLRILLDNPYN